MSLMETVLMLTRNHSQEASESQAKVFNLMQPQKADLIYENLLTLVLENFWKILDTFI